MLKAVIWRRCFSLTKKEQTHNISNNHWLKESKHSNNEFVEVSATKNNPTLPTLNYEDN